MAKTKYKTKVKNGYTYYFYRIYHDNLIKPKDVYDRTVKGLESKIKAELNKLDNNIDNVDIKFIDFFKTWLYDVKAINLKPTTFTKYEDLYNNHIKNSIIANKKIKNIKLHDIQLYYNSLAKEGYSSSMLKQIHKLIAPCISYAYDNNIILKDFTKGLVIPKIEDKEKEINPFTLEEQKAFIEAIKGHSYEVLFLTALFTGLRRGELLALTWDDIDFNNNTININKSLGRYRVYGKFQNIIQEPKTKNAIRTVDIPSKLIPRLKQHRTKQKELTLKSARAWENKHNLVFPSIKNGDYINISSPGINLKRILTKHNIRQIRFHDLRHTYATRLFELDVNPKTVQMLLGHSNISITLNIYTHVMKDIKKDSIDKLNELL